MGERIYTDAQVIERALNLLNGRREDIRRQQILLEGQIEAIDITIANLKHDATVLRPSQKV